MGTGSRVPRKVFAIAGFVVLLWIVVLLAGWLIYKATAPIFRRPRTAVVQAHFEPQNMEITGGIQATLRQGYRLKGCGRQSNGSIRAQVLDPRASLAVTILVSGFEGPRAYTVHEHGNFEAGAPFALATVQRTDGESAGAWITDRGTVTVTAATPISASGLIDATLTNNNHAGNQLDPPIHISGSWSCRSATS